MLRKRLINCHMKKRKMKLEELQSTEFEILKVFHNFCQKNGLRYYLAGGTLIGAVRHKGFIPWDDDIDICMPRPDYMKLVKLAKNGKLDDYRCIYSRYTDIKNPTSIIRIYDNRTEVVFKNDLSKTEFGCWIDLFPLDGVESGKVKRWLHFKEMRLFMDLAICCTTKLGGKRRSKIVSFLQYFLIPLLPLIRLPGVYFYLDMMDRIARRFDYDNSEYVGVLGGRGEEKEAMRKADMEPPILVEFMGNEFYTMRNYDEYLTNLYGDYMTPPPESEQISRHEIDIFWKE